MTADEFLVGVATVPETVVPGRGRSVYIIDRLDRMMSAGEFAAVDEVLRRFDWLAYQSSVRSALLMTASWAADKLTEYRSAYERELALLISERGEEVARRMRRRFDPARVP